ncbi:MAG: polysaccharide deacetylase family protein [Calditrichia bacterium]
MVSITIRYSGLPVLIRRFVSRKKVTILAYHNPMPHVMEKHLNYLSRRYNFITLNHFVHWLHQPGKNHLPDHALIITLDDGLKSDFHLLDTFRKYNINPTIFVCSQVAGTLRHYWFHEPGADLRLLKGLGNQERIRFMLKEMGFNHTNDFPPEERQVLSREEILQMSAVMDFQSHSRFHPLLPACADEESREEIELSKREIESLTGNPCVHFAYPNGDYTGREIHYLKQAGYRSARTLDVGWNDRRTDPYRLRVTGITDDASVNMLAAQLTGVTMFFRYFRKGSFNGRQPEFKFHN